MKRFGVEESDAQAGTNKAGVVVGEGATLIGVELEGKTAAADGLFEGVMKALGVGLEVIGAEGHQAGVIVNDQTQMGGEGLAGGRGVEVGAWGEVDHPEVVDGGGLEALGGTGQGLTALLATSLGMEFMLAQESVDRGQ
jgi:hypothetical protein